MPQIQALFISPGHNFVGHYGGPAGEHPITAVERVQCLAGRGLAGDRYLDHRADYKGQITFLDAAVFAGVCRHLGLSGGHPERMRRNVVVSDLDLNSLIGRTFTLQGVRFAGVEECKPCSWMDQTLGPGAEAWLKGRGGLRARILSDGELQCGGAVCVVESENKIPG